MLIMNVICIFEMVFRGLGIYRMVLSVALQLVGGFVKTVQFYMLCAFVGSVINNIRRASRK